MERESEKAQRRIEIRLSVVSDVLDGRRTLAEAAAVFADLNRAHAGIGQVARARFAGRSETETAALQVIEQVKRSGDPRAAGVSTALKAEFDRGAIAG
jgi:precorrin isomerase